MGSKLNGNLLEWINVYNSNTVISWHTASYILFSNLNMSCKYKCLINLKDCSIFWKWRDVGYSFSSSLFQWTTYLKLNVLLLIYSVYSLNNLFFFNVLRSNLCDEFKSLLDKYLDDNFVTQFYSYLHIFYFKKFKKMFMFFLIHIKFSFWYFDSCFHIISTNHPFKKMYVNVYGKSYQSRIYTTLGSVVQKHINSKIFFDW